MLLVLHITVTHKLFNVKYVNKFTLNPPLRGLLLDEKVILICITNSYFANPVSSFLMKPYPAIH